MKSVAEALEEFRRGLVRIANDAGRDPESVQLIAVSKKHPVEAILEAYRAGQRDFGENYVQELVGKAKELSQFQDIRWHFMGHLQRNKIRFIAGKVHLFHCLDSLRLARGLSQRNVAEASQTSLLVEVNLGREQQKAGCLPEELPALLEAVEELPGLKLRGLMTLPPQGLKPSEFFDRLQELREQNGGQKRLPELSMGMSGDFEAAIRAGATMIRVGTAIFGARPS